MMSKHCCLQVGTPLELQVLFFYLLPPGPPTSWPFPSLFHTSSFFSCPLLLAPLQLTGGGTSLPLNHLLLLPSMILWFFCASSLVSATCMYTPLPAHKQWICHRPHCLLTFSGSRTILQQHLPVTLAAFGCLWHCKWQLRSHDVMSYEIVLPPSK